MCLGSPKYVKKRLWSHLITHNISLKKSKKLYMVVLYSVPFLKGQITCILDYFPGQTAISVGPRSLICWFFCEINIKNVHVQHHQTMLRKDYEVIWTHTIDPWKSPKSCSWGNIYPINYHPKGSNNGYFWPILRSDTNLCGAAESDMLVLCSNKH